MSKYSIVIFCVFFSLSHAAGDLIQMLSKLETDIGRHLCHTLSQRGGLLESIGHNHRFLSTNGHWTKGLSHDSKPTDQNFLLFPGDATSQFHTKLAKKLIDGVASGIIPSSNYSKKGSLKRNQRVPLTVYENSPSTYSKIFKFENDVEPNFIDGHRLTIKSKTRYPKVFINLYQEIEDTPNQSVVPIISKWFMPIEQTFFLSNLEDYKRNIALLSRWAAYSRFVLMVIPADTYIQTHVGITAPQSLIENAEVKNIMKTSKVYGYQTEAYERINKARDYLQKLDPSMTHSKVEESLLKFCEFFPGGATQFFMEEIKDYYLFDIDALYNRNGSSFSPTFSTERERNYIDWVVPQKPKTSHFMHDYKEVEIHMQKGLKKIFVGDEFG